MLCRKSQARCKIFGRSLAPGTFLRAASFSGIYCKRTKSEIPESAERRAGVAIGSMIIWKITEFAKPVDLAANSVYRATTKDEQPHFTPFFQRFPQRNAGIHSFCTKAPRFLLEARSCEEQSAHIQRDVLCTLPEHCGRAGGSWQFSRVSCREGSSRKRFGAKLVARALRPPHRVLHTRQDWPPATEVLQIDRRSLLRGLCLPSGIVLRALFGAQVRDELPHASCVEMGDRTFRENSAVQVAGLDRICLECRCHVSDVGSPVSDLRSQMAS